MTCPLTPCLRRKNKTLIMVIQITAGPPMTPPTIAPRFVGSGFEEVGIGPDVEGVSEESASELGLDAGMDVVSTNVVVGREARLVTELLGIEVGLAGVVIASAVGKSLSVTAAAPQAMYS